MSIFLIVIGLVIKFFAAKSLNMKSWWRIYPPEKIITTGAYKYVRHPIYLANTIFAFGLFWLLCGFKFAIAFEYIYAQFIFNRIDQEEQMLTMLFGKEYLDYLKKTPMLIPFLRRK